MKVKCIAESMLSFDDDEDYYAIETLGYTMHEIDLDDRSTWINHIDELHEFCGRQCYESWGRPNPETATNADYLRKSITDNKHFSVFEHGTLSLSVRGVSRNLLLELERHRFVSFSVVSTRYVEMDDKPIVYPPAFGELPEIDAADLKTEFNFAHGVAVNAYRHVAAVLSEHDYTRKEQREAAREILPGALSADFVATANIRTWREIVEKRGAPGAAKEIQLLAREILVILKDKAPNSVQDLSLEDS